MAEILQSRFPHVSSDILYDAEDQPEALFIPLRCPTNSDFLLGGLRFDLKTLNTTAFLSFPTSVEADSFIQLLTKHLPLLRLHPLYLLLLIFQERYRTWSIWFTSQWRIVSDEIEVATGMTSKKWLARRMTDSSSPLLQQPMDTKVLLERVHEVQAELSHVETVMKFAKRFGDVLLGSIMQFEEARRELGLPILQKRELQELRMRIGCVVSRCQAVDDRVPELKDRLKVQMNVVFGLIAQEDSRNSATMVERQTFISERAAEDSRVMRSIAERQNFISERAAEDSRVMRIIGLLTALFLPITLVTTIWSTSLVDLEHPMDWVVWLIVSVALTGFVTTSLWFYDRQTAAKRKQTPDTAKPEKSDG